MMKKIISILLIVTMLLSIAVMALPTLTFAAVPEGYTEVNSLAGLKSMTPGNKYYLTADIDVTGCGSSCLQSSLLGDGELVLDGNNHTINYKDGTGLSVFLGGGGKLIAKNLNITGTINIPAGHSDHMGTLVMHGFSSGVELTNIHVSTNIVAAEGFKPGGAIGGIMGKSEGTATLNNVSFKGSINTSNGDSTSSGDYTGIGGIIGTARNVVADGIVVEASITVANKATNTLSIGGAFGRITNADSTVTNVTVSGGDDGTKAITISGDGEKHVGGAIGKIQNTITVSNVSTSCKITNNAGGTTMVGGVVGEANFGGNNDRKLVIKNSASMVNISNGSYVGGIVGRAIAADNNSENAGIKVSNCYNGGNIYSNKKDARIAGIFGAIYAVKNLTIENCANTGDVELNKESDPGWYGVAGILGAVMTIAPNLSWSKISSFEANVTNCHNFGHIKTQQSAGGIVGSSFQIEAPGVINVKDCSNWGFVEGNTRAGGIAGHFSLGGETGDKYENWDGSKTRDSDKFVHWVIDGCLNEGTVISAHAENVSSYGNAAGIVPQPRCNSNDYSKYGNTEIKNCVNAGRVWGTWNTAGVVAWNNYPIIITGCANTGIVTKGGNLDSGGTNNGGEIAQNNMGNVTDNLSGQAAYDRAKELRAEMLEAISELRDVNNSNRFIKDNAGWANRPVVGYIFIMNDITLTTDTAKNLTEGGIVGSGYTLTMAGPSTLINWGRNLKITDLKIDGAITVNGDSTHAGALSTNGFAGKNYVENVDVDVDITINGNVNGQAGMLMGKVDKGIILKDVHTAGSLTVTGNVSNNVGGMIGYTGGACTYDNCSNSADITVQGNANESVGGIVGNGDDETFNNVHNSGNITIKGETKYVFGGIAGTSKGATFSGKIYNEGNLTQTGNIGQAMGGITGTTNKAISNVYNTGNITVSGNVGWGKVGGIIGDFNQNVETAFVFENNYNTGTITINATSNATAVGGMNGSIMAAKNVTVNNCYNAGKIILKGTTSTGVDVGGLVGNYNGATITFNNCYNSEDGDITSAQNPNVGGLLGFGTNNPKIVMNNCYNKGDISTVCSDGADHRGLGGVIGAILNGTEHKLTNVSNSGNISVTVPSTGTTKDYNYHAGGIVGRAYGLGLEMDTVTNTGDVISASSKSGWAQTGGIVGNYMSVFNNADSYLKINNALNTGKIVGGYGAGGILGGTRQLQSDKVVIEIKNSKNIGIIEANNVAGGITGNVGSDTSAMKSFTVENCVNTGAVTSLNPAGGYRVAGGIVGSFEKAGVAAPTIKNCVNSGTVWVKENVGRTGDCWASAGGILGGTFNAINIEGCVNLGEVKTNSQYGAFAITNSVENRTGNFDFSTIAVSDSYYLADVSKALDSGNALGVAKDYTTINAVMDGELYWASFDVIKALIEMANGINLGKYTQFSSEKLTTALAAANTFVAENEAAYTADAFKKQADISATEKALGDAINGLVEKANFLNPLKDSIKAAEEKAALDVYTDDTWAAFAKALEAAKAVLAKGEMATEDDVRDAVVALDAATAALVAGGVIRTEADFALLNGSAGTFTLAGNLTVNTPVANFKGTLDGQGYTLTAPNGIFTAVEGATIKNATLVLGKTAFGTAAGTVKVENVTVAKANVTGAALFADVAADASVTIKNVVSYANTTAAGLVEKATGAVVVDTVVVAANTTGAGLVGVAAGAVTVKDTVVQGNVAGEETYGLVAKAGTLTISNTFYTGVLAGKKANAISASAGTFTNAYAWALNEAGYVVAGSSAAEVIGSGEAAYETRPDVLVQVIGRDAVPALGEAYADGSNVVIKVESKYQNVVPTYTKPVAPTQPVAPDYSALQAAITAAKALVEADYTAEAWAKLKAAITEAEKALTSVSAMEIETARIALNQVVTSLVKKPTVTPAPTLDFTALDAAIEKAEALKEADYTAKTWGMMRTMLLSAKFAKSADTQAVVDEALKALNDAVAALEKAPAPVAPDANKPADDTPADKPAATEPAAKDGCGSAITGAAVVLAAVVALGAGVSFKKKED